jgi:uncharacterized membrane protein (TIGR02234 family)
MTGRRELLVAVALCLLGSALVLLAMSRPWLTFRLGAVAPLPSRTLDLSGARLAPGARVLGFVGLAGVAALPAARGLGRTAVGVLLAAAGVGLALDLVRALSDPAAAVGRGEPLHDVHLSAGLQLGGWPYVALLGGVLITAAGLLVVVRGRRWEALSPRYDAPTAKPPPGESSLWDALDRGEDPTG